MGVVTRERVNGCGHELLNAHYEQIGGLADPLVQTGFLIQVSILFELGHLL